MTLPLRISVPATISNIGPGFDCFGMAVDLELELEARPAERLAISAEGPTVPLDDRNLVVRTLLEHLPKGAEAPRLALHMRNRIPLSRGLGSSAAARVAGLALAEALTVGADAVDRAHIASRATALEGHPDNAVPAVFGGFCISAGDAFERLELDDRSYLLVIPELEIETEAARHALPKTVSLEDAVFNLQHAALSVARIARARNLAAAAPFPDRLHQSHRLSLAPKLLRLFESLAESHEVESVFLSGSGSTLVVLAEDLGAAEARAVKLLESSALEGICLTARASSTGLRVEAL